MPPFSFPLRKCILRHLNIEDSPPTHPDSFPSFTNTAGLLRISAILFHVPPPEASSSPPCSQKPRSTGHTIHCRTPRPDRCLSCPLGPDSPRMRCSKISPRFPTPFFSSSSPIPHLFLPRRSAEHGCTSKEPILPFFPFSVIPNRFFFLALLVFAGSHIRMDRPNRRAPTLFPECRENRRSRHRRRQKKRSPVSPFRFLRLLPFSIFFCEPLSAGGPRPAAINWARNASKEG